MGCESASDVGDGGDDDSDDADDNDDETRGGGDDDRFAEVLCSARVASDSRPAPCRRPRARSRASARRDDSVISRSRSRVIGSAQAHLEHSDAMLEHLSDEGVRSFRAEVEPLIHFLFQQQIMAIVSTQQSGNEARTLFATVRLAGA